MSLTRWTTNGIKTVRTTNLSLKYQRFTPPGYKGKVLENLSLRQWLNSFPSKFFSQNIFINKLFVA